ncbi:methylated-DNA--protein-cysteine methyltransferase [Acrocarpospora pleiomorpha]|jgi:methylated-DNA-[protein]-cysteine S-methyltransferase|uniref:methylated-DNA--[protein]-cysteine S-methyltransferase n=1 Tax=Acrocarpospora pleiomorpha TaxID=90975 RepID=A0A5M3XWB9_9ACTN|nr:methylated-DNA--[protein]-cysteine S-methyltransferase [Acrocarpospora pleiomorpha]GES25246.1 methylated-DNA--protein-cysteine methyltransferase [Acrocarpospora pleiomorpha]
MSQGVSTGDLEALLRVTAPNYVGETPPDVAFGTAETPVGGVVLAVTSRGVVACSFESEHTVFARIYRDVGRFIGPDPRRLDPVRRELDAYFAGRLRAFTVPFDLRLATPFARTVLPMMVAVGYGSVTTYQEIAGRIGRPQALRAVANAITANPVCLVVPCHRAIDSSGSIGSYAGGAPAKEHLLRMEGVLN